MPLSDHEQRLLDQMEQALYAEDPASRRIWGVARRSHKHHVIGAIGAAILGLGLVIVGVNTTWVVGGLGFVIMVGALAYAFAPRAGSRPPPARPLEDARPVLVAPVAATPDPVPSCNAWRTAGTVAAVGGEPWRPPNADARQRLTNTPTVGRQDQQAGAQLDPHRMGRHAGPPWSRSTPAARRASGRLHEIDPGDESGRATRSPARRRSQRFRPAGR